MEETLQMANASIPVTADNFDRAETDRYFKRYVELGGFGKFFHIRQPTPLDMQDVVRMNRDTLYSAVIVDLAAGPVTIIKPESGGRFQSLVPVNEDHSVFPTEHDAGEFTYTQEQLRTRYAIFIVRTFADPADPADIAAANILQDCLSIRQASAGSFEVPNWDQDSLKQVRDAYTVLALTKQDFSSLFGIKGQMDRLDHMLGTAAGWGGQPRGAAMYESVVPTQNDGMTPYVLKVRNVPVDGFWSITVYNKDGFLERNEYDAYSFNNITAAKDEDEGVTLHFGGDPAAANYLPITPGWGYVVRLYRPRQEILDGTWQFPLAEPA